MTHLSKMSGLNILNDSIKIQPSGFVRRWARAGNLIARLDQIEFGCPFDGRTTIIDTEFVVDAFGM